VSPRRRLAYGGAIGVLGVVVPAVGLIILPIWRFPPTGASGLQIVAFAGHHRAALQAVMLSYTLGVSLWMMFGGVVWVRLRSALEPDSWSPTLFAVGLVGFVTLLLAGFTALDVVIYRRAGPSEARLLYDLTFGLLAMSGPPTALCLGAYAVAVYRTGVLPRYTAHLASVTAAAHLLLLLSFVVENGFFSLEGTVISVIPAPLWAWFLVTGFAMLRNARHAAVDTPATRVVLTSG
jgi:hypothetical protein